MDLLGVAPAGGEPDRQLSKKVLTLTGRTLHQPSTGDQSPASGLYHGPESGAEGL